MKTLKKTVKRASKHFRDRSFDGDIAPSDSGDTVPSARLSTSESVGDNSEEEDDLQGVRLLDPESLQSLTQLIHHFSGKSH
jgi:hypothetical protein